MKQEERKVNEMAIMDWFPAGIVLSLGVFAIFAYTFARGIAVITDQRRGFDRKPKGIAKIYIFATKKKLTEIGFYLLLFLLPLICIFLPGILISPMEASSLMISNWYAFFGMILLSLSLPYCMTPTGEE